MRKESIGLFLIGGLIGVVLTTILLVFLYREESGQYAIVSLVLEFAFALILLVTIYFIYRQALSTEKLADITSKPQISVGIMSFKNLREMTVNQYDMGDLEYTRIIIKNFSNFTAFVWTKVKLEIDGKEESKHLENKDYCLNRAAWELDPNEMMSPLILGRSILDYKNQEISISVLFYSSSVRKLPKNPEWIELTTYSYRKKERQWLKNNLGVPFFIQGLIK